jgi:predicted RNase H-like HicB family nuclease
MLFKGTVIISQEEELYVATCLENNIASQGQTINQALENLKEAIELYYEDEDFDKAYPMQNSQVFMTTLEMTI